MGPLTKLLMRFFLAPDEPYPDFLRNRVLRGRCPVCDHMLDARHNVAHIGACNVANPDPDNEFLRAVKKREWQKVMEPFSRITSLDLMSCEVVRCPSGFALLVWMQIDMLGYFKESAVHTERLSEDELHAVEGYVPLEWLNF